MDLRDKLGRAYRPDPRDSAYPLAAILADKPPRTAAPTYKYWYSRFDVDQTGPTCVANSWAHKLGDSPRTYTLSDLDALSLPQGGTAATYQSRSGQTGFRGYVYDYAQALDEWPGEGYEGTSVRAGAKAVQAHNLIDSYWWAATVSEISHALLTTSPVVFGGLVYYQNLQVPAGGEWKPEGGVAGGHAFVLDGHNTRTRLFRVQTWGRHYWISWETLEAYLADQGEACVATEQA